MKKRKIGILTQPLHTNYGGLLQNYALQKVLRDMGHDVETINLDTKDYQSFYSRGVLYLKFVIKKFLLRVYNGPVFPYILSNSESRIITKYTARFIKDFININNLNCCRITEKQIGIVDYDTYIVGSDQVWRPCYSPFLPNYFLDFLSSGDPSLKIAYAASFGVDKWEFSQNETAMAKFNITKFDLITVREDSAISLCKDNLDIDAKHVLDPTLLLDIEDYENIINKNKTYKPDGEMLVYVLDSTLEKQGIIDKIADMLNLKAFKVMPNKLFCKKKPENVNDYVYPSVEQWLRGFFEAKFIITDSFHGTVFSILFNKPFVVIANSARGISRFTSLLRLFNLQHRLINDVKDLDSSLLSNIDYSEIKIILDNYKKYSKSILKSCLENH